MGDGAGDIIIKGGSVEILFDDTLYKKKNGDPGKHENRDRKITKIQIIDENQKELFSQEHQGGLKLEVKVTTR